MSASNRADMDPDAFLQFVYDRFRAANAWPSVRELLIALRPLNVRLLAAEIGTDLVVCEQQADGVCFVRLAGLARCQKATDDIYMVLAAHRFIAAQYIKHGAAPVTSDAIAEALRLSPDALRRLGLILFREQLPASGGSWQPDGSKFSVNPSEESVLYDDVTTLEDLFEKRRKAADEAIAVATQLHRPWTDRLGVSAGPESQPEESAQRGTMRVFISWSGDRSHKLAVRLHDWLPSVIQAVQPYVSSENIHKGARWPIELAEELEQTAFGILCLVPGNIDAAWLNFEAGALSKIVKGSRVVPLLFGGLKPKDLVSHPLGQFQAAVFEKAELLKTLESMNEVLGSAKLGEGRLAKVFQQWWPSLSHDVESILQVDESATSTATRVEPQAQPELEDTEQKIMSIWAKLNPDLALLVGHVAGTLNITEQRAKFYLDQLCRRKYLHDLHAMGRPTKYTITHEGREFLVRAGLA